MTGKWTTINLGTRVSLHEEILRKKGRLGHYVEISVKPTEHDITNGPKLSGVNVQQFLKEDCERER